MTLRAIHLTAPERETLLAFAHSGEHLVRLVIHAWILLWSDEGWSCEQIMRALHVGAHRITAVRRRYLNEGLDACLKDRPRKRKRTVIIPHVVEQLTALACSKPPKGRKKWTIALLAEYYTKQYGQTISESTIQKILKTHHLKPWKKKMWCIPKVTPEFLKRMYALLDLYALAWNPEEPVVCVDEKHKQILAHVRDPLPLGPNGHGIREDDHYKRMGSANIFVAVNPLEGWRLVQVTDHRKKTDYAAFLQQVIAHYPNAKKIHIVADNLNTHSLKALHSVLEQDDPLFDRVELHFTPTHASWLNQAEIEIGVMDQQCTGRRFHDRQELEAEVAAWASERNRKQVRIEWGYTRAKAEAKFEPVAVT